MRQSATKNLQERNVRTKRKANAYGKRCLEDGDKAVVEEGICLRSCCGMRAAGAGRARGRHDSGNARPLQAPAVEVRPCHRVAVDPR